MKYLKRSTGFNQPLLIAAAMFLMFLAACGGGGGGLTLNPGQPSPSPSKPLEGCETGGVGLIDKPYKICTARDLADLADRVNGGLEPPDGRYYLLDGNINLGGPASPWTPIGNYDNPFMGEFNGNGKTISGIYINDSALDYAGLFGSIGRSDHGARVYDLVITNVNITGRDYVGGVAGYSITGGVSVLSVSGEVNGRNNVGGVVGLVASGGANSRDVSVNVSGRNNVGGVAGLIGEHFFSGGFVSYSYATGDVSGNENVGGVAGRVNDSSRVNDSYATGNVNGNENVGGVVGDYSGRDEYSYVRNSYSTGDVSGNKNVGGVAGRVSGSPGVSSPGVSYGPVSNSYSTGSVSGNENVGGVAGEVSWSAVSNSYATGDVSGVIVVGGVAGYVAWSTVSNSYATGSVSGNGFVGGVAGIINDSTVKNCAALNNSITRTSGTSTSFGSVAGRNFDGTLTNNVGYDLMLLPGGADGAHGTYVSKDNATTRVYYTGTLYWTFNAETDTNPWVWGGSVYPLPVLYWQRPDQIPPLPTHLQ